MTETPKAMQKHQNDKFFKAEISPPAADVFFDIFCVANMRGELLGDLLLLPGEKGSFDSGSGYFHIVNEGHFLLEIQGTTEKNIISPGDIIFIPNGNNHCIECIENSSVENKDSDLETPRRIKSGIFKFDRIGSHALMLGLPRLLHVSSRADAEPDALGSKEWLSLTVAAMQKETENPSIGSVIMLSRIIDLMFIWAVRSWLINAPASATGWIAALRDPMVGHALALLHAEPGADWTVEKLALKVNQSRSNLANKFGQLVGESPMRYLTRWRMQLASQRIKASHLRISQIAAELGYDSDAAFSRAFRREFGLTPSEYRSSEHHALNHL